VTKVSLTINYLQIKNLYKTTSYDISQGWHGLCIGIGTGSKVTTMVGLYCLMIHLMGHGKSTSKI